MDIIGNYKNVLTNKYAQLNGRAGRPEFWLFVLVNFVISMVFYILTIVAATAGSSTLALVFNLVLLVYGLATLVPTIAVGVRRLHDIGKEGVWFCINFIPLVGGLWYLYLCAQEGERTENRFGEPQP